MDSDGSNKQKVIDVDSCINVQFIPNSSKILFMSPRNDGSFMKQLHTVNIDGTDSLQISGDYLLRVAQPTVSDDGDKIVFWALHDSRDYYYDLYLTDPLGLEIVNLTDTENVSEKDASFIEYQGQEYLLYVTYFNENNANYSTISMMNMDTFSVDTLYVEEIDDEWGFKYPVYYPSEDFLFTAFGQVGLTAKSKLLFYDALQNGNHSVIPIEIYGQKMEINIEYSTLIVQSSDIMIYDIDYNEVKFLTHGYKFHSYHNNVIYSTNSQTTDGNIYSVNLDGTDNTLLAEDGYYPRYSEDGSQIVYIGRYPDNKKRNMITN
jgi:hypothetical protein